ncbi:MAG: hypothetical protein DMF59_08240 [Acidobacteria bacterium]|nr:MAG: hypothetical protein DMF59_08240 [Acidobacteriota bacterium]
MQPLAREPLVLFLLRFLRGIDHLNDLLDVRELRSDGRLLLPFGRNANASDALLHDDRLVDDGIDRRRQHAIVLRGVVDRRNRDLERAGSQRIEDLVGVFEAVKLVERQTAIELHRQF